jgi:hypothetical protein
MRHRHSSSTAASAASRFDDGARNAHVASGASHRSSSATVERTLAHVFTSPVVREVLPTRSRAVATW